MKKFISKVVVGIMIATTIFGSSAFAAEEKTLTIIHTNDVHAAVVDNGKSQIGLAKLGGYVEELRKSDEILVLDAGDMFQGLPIANLEKGKSMLPMVNEVGYDAMADVKPEQSILDAIKKVEDKQKEILDKVVGKTSKDLVGERTIVRTGESNLGQLATDAMLDLTKADVAITNGGGIRAWYQ